MAYAYGEYGECIVLSQLHKPEANSHRGTVGPNLIEKALYEAPSQAVCTSDRKTEEAQG